MRVEVHFFFGKNADVFSPTGTVQKQYTSGTHRIVQWASLTNAHIFPGPAIITALHEAAKHSLTRFSQSVSTEITAGTPRHSMDGSEEMDALSNNPFFQNAGSGTTSGDGNLSPDSIEEMPANEGRKNSIVNVETRITQSTTTRHAQLKPTRSTDAEAPEPDLEGLEALGSPPLARGLLLLAEMSSADNLFTPAYTSKCVSMARDNSDFVVGFIAQQGLNSKDGDNFITFTPGVQLGKSGDGLGQKYRTPRKVVLQEGCDVVIVGRGILEAEDRRAEAERYRKEAWGAYVERVKGKTSS